MTGGSVTAATAGYGAFICRSERMVRRTSIGGFPPHYAVRDHPFPAEEEVDLRAPQNAKSCEPEGPQDLA